MPVRLREGLSVPARQALAPDLQPFVPLRKPLQGQTEGTKSPLSRSDYLNKS